MSQQVHCDQCGITGDTREHPWLHLTSWRSDGPLADFCSYGCLIIWAGVQ